jgi:hypothetical protein
MDSMPLPLPPAESTTGHRHSTTLPSLTNILTRKKKKKKKKKTTW